MARAAQKSSSDLRNRRSIDLETIEQSQLQSTALPAQIANLGQDDDPKIRVLRAKRRTSTQIDADLVSASGCQATIVCNVSRYGAGLVGIHGVRKSEIVALRLLGGQIIHGNVRWHRGNRCGIAFLEPLADNSQLMIEAGLTLSSAVPKIAVRLPQLFAAPHSIKSVAAWLRSILKAPLAMKSFRMLRALSPDLRSHLHRKSPDRAMQRACREQGFAWLIDEETNASSRRPTELG